MNSTLPQHRIWRHFAIALCALLIGGCAGIPRIDPTGERVFVWPEEIANQQGVPQSGVPAIGNPQVAPVYTAPVFPAPPLPGTPGVPQVPQDVMTLSPQRVLAPVGSEVILKAGLCTSEQFMLTKTPVNWLIARESAGEFVDLGGKGWCSKPLLPWNKPKKIDNQYATGYSSCIEQTLTRGTPNTSDDVVVGPGEAWASITSPVEGTSHITAMTPEIESWAQRKATATIYWVDVQWSFPPTSVTASNSEVLTTTVRRQTDGTPLEGWIVRYEVVGGAASLPNNPAGQTVVVRTDADGKASIDVTPTGDGGNTTQIKTQLVRPADYRNTNSPELVVGNGTTAITWNGGSSYLPPPDDLGALPLNEPPPSNVVPSVPVQPTQPIQPAPPPAVITKPVLDLEVRGDNTAQVNDIANVQVVIKNIGDAVATGMSMIVEFDQGLSHPGDTDRINRIEKNEPNLPTIPPGGSITENIEFNTIQSGLQNLNVIVSCRDGGPPISKPLTINIPQPPAPPVVPPIDVVPTNPPPGADVIPQPNVTPGTLAVGITLPATEIRINQRAKLQFVVKNSSELPERNVKLVVTFPPELTPEILEITNNANVNAQLSNNQVIFQPVGELQPGQKLDYRIPITANNPGVRYITAEITSLNVTTPVKAVESIEILGR